MSSTQDPFDNGMQRKDNYQCMMDKNYNIQPSLLTSHEAASLIRMSETWLAHNRLAKQNTIPFVKIGRRVLYNREVLLKWLKKAGKN